MRTIYKYAIATPPRAPHEEECYLPKGAKILHVAVQNGALCVWALVDPDAEKERRFFYVIGTGLAFDNTGYVPMHIGSVLDGRFVWHVFTDAIY